MLDTAPAAGAAAKSFTKQITGNSIINKTVEVTTDTISKVTETLSNVSNQVIDNVVGNYDTFSEESVLTPYNGLYRLEKTGFKYVLPYLQDDYNSLTNSMEMNGGENFFSDVGAAAGDAAAAAAGLAFALRPGVYIEESKQYNMPQEGRKITVSFPLLNTGQFSDILQNWQLLFGLIYQNRPGRITKTLVDIPVLYESFVEGVVFMPYSYITNLEIRHAGNRRSMKINIPKIESTKKTNPTNLEINAVIPDAYMVNITLTSLNEETRNFLIESIQPGLVTSRNINPIADIQEGGENLGVEL